MTQKDYQTIELMRVYGGSFVQRLAELAMAADDDNLSRIKSAWPEYWTTYQNMAEQRK